MFMNSKIIDKIDLKRSDKYIRFLTLSIYYTLKNIKKLYKNNIFNTSAQTQSVAFDLPDESYSVSDIRDNFEYVIKLHKEFVDNSPVTI